SDVVTVDMNHPLAGEDLTFAGKVVENRMATNEEIQNTLNDISGDGCEGCGDDGCCESCGR
ncbi:hypothetical protein EZS27_023471, partial [termite gut metagenome]